MKEEKQAPQNEEENSAKFVPKYNPAQQEQEQKQTKEAPFQTLEQIGRDIAQKRKSRGKPMEQTARISRELTRQSSRPLPAQQKELFEHLSPKAREHAIILNKKDSLLSSLIDGLDGSELTYKVIIALAITLYEQSELYGTTSSLTGASELLLPFLCEAEDKDEEKPQPKPKLKIKPTAGKIVAEGVYVTSSCPIVFINVSEFTKLVNGTDEKPSSKDKKAVKDVLETLRSKKAYMGTEDGKWMFKTLIGKEIGGIDTKTQAELIALELDSIFTRMIKEDFSIIRKDTLRKLRGRQKRMTMRLLHYLLGQFSYHNPVCHISKENLFLRIAIIDAYNKNLKRREEDFQTAIRKMEDCKLILPVISFQDNYGKTLYDKKGGYYEEIGADGYSLYSNFRLNPDYTKGEPIEPENGTELHAEDTEPSDPVHNTPE